MNLGTPRSPSVPDVRRYLREFLSDPRVIDIPWIPRMALLYLFILPFRPRRSAAAYRQIWTDQGSPLLVNSRALRDEVSRSLGPGIKVELGMRYGEPSLHAALQRLVEAGCRRLLLLPLFPQYAESSTGSALHHARVWLDKHAADPDVSSISWFYDHPDFIEALASVSRPELDTFHADHVLLSYHGLPERQVRRTDSSGEHCLANANCCATIGPQNQACYRAQCFATTRALAQKLGWDEDSYSTGFQSRLGRTPWIQPFTDELLPEFSQRGVKRLAILCPSFVADCLETLEEIGIRARTQWQELGGDALTLIPCLNASPDWVEGLAGIVRRELS